MTYVSIDARFLHFLLTRRVGGTVYVGVVTQLLTITASKLDCIGLCSKPPHGECPEKWAYCKRCEGISPSERVYHLRNEVNWDHRKHEPNARLDGEHGSDVGAVG